MANSIKIGDLEKAINEELTIYCDDVTEKVKKISDDVMNTLVKNTKKDANKRTGTYAKAIASKRTLETKRSRVNTWYVKDPEYRKSHLLEKGHATRNGGRTRAFPFISKNEQIAVKDYENQVEEAIKNGS